MAGIEGLVARQGWPPAKMLSSLQAVGVAHGRSRFLGRPPCAEGWVPCHTVSAPMVHMPLCNASLAYHGPAVRVRRQQDVMCHSGLPHHHPLRGQCQPFALRESRDQASGQPPALLHHPRVGTHTP